MATRASRTDQEARAYTARVILYRKKTGDMGGFKFCAESCPRLPEPSGESRCCSICSPSYLESIHPMHHARILADSKLKPLPGPQLEVPGAKGEDHGFWRKGKGCVLPLELRPNMCLAYWCHDVGKAHPEIWAEPRPS